MPNVYSQPRSARFSLKRDECMHYVHQIHILTQDYTQILANIDSSDDRSLPMVFRMTTMRVVQAFHRFSATALQDVRDKIDTNTSQMGNNLLMTSPPITDRPTATFSTVSLLAEALIAMFRTQAAANALAHQFVSQHSELSVLFTKHKISDEDIFGDGDNSPLFSNQLALPLPASSKHLYPCILIASSFFTLANKLATELTRFSS